jgi:4-diphosphocytidyl-2-C-methyl-D-erythritol kinase
MLLLMWRRSQSDPPSGTSIIGAPLRPKEAGGRVCGRFEGETMARTARAFVLNARAKFNLSLEVGPVARNGLHAVWSVVCDLRIADTVAFRPASVPFAVSCDDPSIAPDENLATRAARALGVDLPSIHVDITKRIPSQAGLGGGSADAAATMRGIASVLAEEGAAVSEGDLMAAASRTGSDVAACLVPGMKVVHGTGEIVERLAAPPPQWGIVLLKPAGGVPTQTAYRLLDESRSSRDHDRSSFGRRGAAMRCALVDGDFAAARKALHNDFQAVVEAEFPAVRLSRERLEIAGADATVLCGSGSCVAGIFEDGARAAAALATIAPGPAEWAAVTDIAAND